jgi:hypothetical protein
MFNNGATATLTNCAFSDNSASLGSGGGVFNNGARTTLTNCTVSGNSPVDGGGVWSVYGTSALTNKSHRVGSGLSVYFLLSGKVVRRKTAADSPGSAM